MKGEMSFILWFARLVALAGVIFFLLFLYAVYATAHDILVNGDPNKQVSITFMEGGE